MITSAGPLWVAVSRPGVRLRHYARRQMMPAQLRPLVQFGWVLAMHQTLEPGSSGRKSQELPRVGRCVAQHSTFPQIQQSATYPRRRVIRGRLWIWPPCCPLAGGLDGFDPHGQFHMIDPQSRVMLRHMPHLWADAGLRYRRQGYEFG